MWTEQAEGRIRSLSGGDRVGPSSDVEAGEVGGFESCRGSQQDWKGPRRQCQEGDPGVPSRVSSGAMQAHRELQHIPGLPAALQVLPGILGPWNSHEVQRQDSRGFLDINQGLD